MLRKINKCSEILNKFHIYDKVFETIKCLKWDAENHLDEFKKKRNDLRKKFEKLKSELEKRDFKIGVVGLESSGKSSLINAYIDKDFLPTATERCTYTTTTIKSCSDKKSQKYSIYYFTREEFKEYENVITGLLSSNDEYAKREFDEINKLRNNINQYLDKKPETRNFENFEELQTKYKK